MTRRDMPTRIALGRGYDSFTLNVRHRGAPGDHQYARKESPYTGEFESIHADLLFQQSLFRKVLKATYMPLGKIGQTIDLSVR
jgi:hypothetical protein